MRRGDQRLRPLDAGLLFEIDTGHDLVITEPDAVTSMLIEAAPMQRTPASAIPSAAAAEHVLDVCSTDQTQHLFTRLSVSIDG